MIGARLATDLALLAPLRRLIARATARGLQALVIPGPDVALAAGLDLEAAGLELADGPRQANVLVVVGPLSPGMADAASVAYAQMPRPRSVLALGADDVAPLPPADASEALSQAGLEQAVGDLRHGFATGAFATDVSDFDARALQSRIEYTCPMHPEVVSDEPGNCPKCGMFLVPRETSAAAGGGGHDHGSKATMPAAANADAHLTGPVHDSQVVGENPAHEGASAAHYTCPMHPEVVSDEPGDCPKCGMTLVPAEAPKHAAHGHDHTHHAPAPQDGAQYTCPMHPEVINDEPGNCPKCGMTLVPAEAPKHAAHGHDHAHHDPAPQDGAQYTCPMHPEVVSDEPGNCPKCGMTLVPMDSAGGSGEQDHSAHASHDQSDAQTGWLEQIEPGFMSMIAMTEGTPRSSDGLQMEWITTAFGPFFPGLPGGLTLDLTLDGDTVVEARAGSLVGGADLLQDGPLPAADYVDGLAAHMRLAPVSYRLLACRAIEAAAGLAPDEDAGQRREAALERERISSHLFWLSQMGRQLGLVRIGREAAALGLMLRTADQVAIRGRMAAVNGLIANVRSTRFLTLRLAEAGHLPVDAEWLGPASDDNTAAGRLAARLTDLAQSLGRIDAAPGIAAPELVDIADASGHGHARLETPRGEASLHVEVDAGRVVSAMLHTPSPRHVELIGPITEQRELADALVGVASLDLDPWEIGA